MRIFSTILLVVWVSMFFSACNRHDTPLPIPPVSQADVRTYSLIDSIMFYQEDIGPNPISYADTFAVNTHLSIKVYPVDSYLIIRGDTLHKSIALSTPNETHYQHASGDPKIGSVLLTYNQIKYSYLWSSGITLKQTVILIGIRSVE